MPTGARSDLDEHEQAVYAAVDVRRLLRHRVEQHAEGVWRSFEEAMHATLHDGSPDRDAAGGDPCACSPRRTDAGGAALEDELAQLRARRSASAR